jgi:hypothetical protein
MATSKLLLKFKVSRNAIYGWVQIAERNLETAFCRLYSGKEGATASRPEPEALIVGCLSQIITIAGSHHSGAS